MSNYKAWDDITQKQKIERWENVLRVLTKMTPHQRKKHFDMGDWLSETDCGTVGCAAGFCAVDPWFRRRGFKMDKLKFWDEIEEKNEFYYEFAEGANPAEFFGFEGYDYIFTNSKFTDHKGVGIHRKVVKAVKDYIEELKDGLS